MFSGLRFFTTGLFMLLLPLSLKAQLAVTTGQAPAQLVQTIVGPGYTVQNIKLNCPQLAIGTFVSNGTNIGLPDGLILTTGRASLAIGPNNNVSAGFNNGTPGDNDLDILSGATTYDACVLEFDLIPACDTLRIQYVFGSEEYPEFVGSEFNDVFAFYISGPGIAGTQNIALVPGTTNPVSINEINAGKNAGWFINNNNGSTIQYDGFTRPLIAQAKVIPCETYHLKLAIADVTDGIFESGVFIKGNTIECSPIVYNDVASNVNGIEACNQGSFTFCRTGDSTQAFTVKYQLGGTAINGVDYVTLPDSVVIPAGQRCATVNVITIDDGLPEPQEVIEVAYQYGMCPRNDTLRITVNDPVPINAGPDVSFCPGDSSKIGMPMNGGLSYSWSPATGLSSPSSPVTQVTLNNTGSTPLTATYVLSASYPGGCVLRDTVRVTVRPDPVASFTASSVCIGSKTSFTDLSSGSGGSALKSWYWTFGNSSLIDTARNPSPMFQTPGSYSVTLVVTDQYGCTDDTNMTVQVWPSPVVDFTFDTACIGDTVHFINLTTVPGGGIVAQTVWNFGDNSPLSGVNHPAHIYSAGGNYDVELIVNTDRNCTGSKKRIIFVAPKPVINFTFTNVCQNDSAKMINNSVGDKWRWDFGDGDTSSIRNPFHQWDSAGFYTIRLLVTNKYGCSDSTSRPIEVFPAPTADYYADTAAGCAPLCINFQDETSSVDSLKDWNWIFASGFQATGVNTTFCFEDTGSFSPALIATSTKGCKDTIIKQSFITVYPKPAAGFMTDPSSVSTFYPIVNFIDGSAGAVQRWWNFGDGATDTVPNPVHKYEKAGTFQVMQVVKNQYGCYDTLYRNVYVENESTIYIPNAFTPDGDGINDTFFPEVTGPLLEAEYRMYIYDRWGAKMFVAKNINEGWDGILRGRLCQADVYTYLIVFTPKGSSEQIARYVGRVTLMR